MLSEQILKHLGALSDHAERILRRPTEKIELLRDPLHRQRVREI